MSTIRCASYLPWAFLTPLTRAIPNIRCFEIFRVIDEDEELEENKRKFAESFEVLKKETEKAKTEVVNCQLKLDESSLSKTYVKPITWQDGLKKELDEIKERLAKLENK